MRKLQMLHAAQQLFPGTLETATVHGIPLYDGDLESDSGIPAAVVTLKDRIVAAEGVLLFTPEYNNSMPGVFKNAIDWLSRPSEDIPRVFHDRPFGLLGATPGNFGTTHAQTAWLQVLRTLRVKPWFAGRVLVSGAAKLVNDRGELSDEPTRQRLKDYVAAFIDFAQAETGSAR